MKAKRLYAGILPVLAAMMMALMVTSCDDEPGPPGYVNGPWELSQMLCSGPWQGTRSMSTPGGYQSTTEVFYFLDQYNGVYRQYYVVNGYSYDDYQQFTYRCYDGGDFDVYMQDGSYYQMNYYDYTIYDSYGQYGWRSWTPADYDWLNYYGFYY